MSEELSQEVVGAVGRVSVSISDGRPGEVMIPIRGGVKAYQAPGGRGDFEELPRRRRGDHFWSHRSRHAVLTFEETSCCSGTFPPQTRRCSSPDPVAAIRTHFRIVTGHGCFVIPIKQKARYLSLSLRESEITEECITTQGIRLHVRAIAAFKIGDDAASIANAARRFLAEQNNMEELVGRIFAGHLRSIIGSLTVEEIIRERDRLAQEVKNRQPRRNGEARHCR